MRKLFYFFGYIFSLCIHAYGQKHPYQFMRMDVRQGLSHNQVNTIFKDSKGFLWFGTMSGLNRFDGYDVRVFRNNINDTTSLSDNYISNIFELPNKKLWITTRNGNNIYDPFTESFNRNDQKYLSSLSLPGGVVSSIVKDKQQNYWFVYQNLGGIYKYITATKKVIPFHHIEGDSTTIASNDIAILSHDSHNNTWIIYRNGFMEKLDAVTNQVVQRTDQLKIKSNGRTQNYALFIDKDNELWISVFLSATPGGIYYYRPTLNKVEILSKDSGQFRLNTNIVTGIVQSNDDKIWIGTDHGGMNIVDKKNKQVQYLLSDAEDHTSISQNSIWSVYKDNSGVIWLGTFKQGINYYSNQLALFNLFKHKTTDANSLPFEDINKFAEDALGNLWIGTNGGGLLYYNRKTNQYKTFRYNPDDPGSISSDVVVSLCLDHENKLWIGTYFGGLNCYDGKTFTHFRRNVADTNSISDDSIWEIFEDSDNNLWMGTLTGGLNLFDRDKKTFKHYRVEDNRSMHSNYISSIIEDKHNNIWFGTSYGIDILNKKTGKFSYLGHDDNVSNSLSNNNIISLLEDSRGLIWVGTREGLNVINKDGKTFSVFRTTDGLPDNTILTILEDSRHTLWLSTPNGLSNVVVHVDGSDEVTLQCVNYDESNGLQGRDFNDKASLKTKSGELIFGGPYGFNIFSPEKFLTSPKSPGIVFTHLQVFNENIQPLQQLNGQVILQEAIPEAKSVTLKYNQNVFSVTFAALGAGVSPKDKFQYMLEGFSKEWLTTDGRQRTITYTNIDPGKYTLKIKSLGSSTAEATNIAALEINILPPFWKTAPAFLLYILAGLGILIIARQRTINRANIRFQIAQQKKEAKRMHELDMLKLKFFTNVSHEFRTPISLIMAPVEKMMKGTEDAGEKKQFQLIYRNAKRLLALVNQLLDFRKLEMQELRLYPSVGDIVGFVKELTLSFTDLAEKKNINFTFSTTHEVIEMSFDPDKIERIMFNLLSNAFKFTNELGNIEVAVKKRRAEDNAEIVDIYVSDDGIGIPPESKQKIFERFFQHETPDSMLKQGSGIGLAISKEFIRLHGGSISVDSEPGKGTTFIVSLPLTGYATPQQHRMYQETEVLMHKADSEGDNNDTTLQKRKGSVLVIDDNDDIRFYIKDNLRNTYTVYQAASGLEGWEKAQRFQPDLIISDVMMPDMDGLELCRKIKQDTRTSHIPVILLTARTADNQKLEGLNTGANDYITKPFSFEILQSRIKNLMQQQEAMRKLFQKQIDVKPGEISATPVDEQFIAKAIDIVEKNIAETEFSVEDLSKALFMSRVALYKKLLSLTGKAPLDFIRTLRMKRAAQLMEKTQMTVSEIAYEVGFSNPKYFAKFFKKEFDILPSEYIASKRKK
jgi:signal transduction histidine kinase/ligand-binding sensor domain-containing protein/DNA-binding response OmpR family regulator